jgi:hypothetical protein
MTSGTRKKPRVRRRRPFDEEASRALAEQLLGEADVPSAIIGKVAVWAWVEELGEHEMTKDVDYAVSTEHIQQIVDSANARGYVTTDLDIGGINVEVAALGINVDFIHRNSRILGDLSGLFQNAIDAAHAEATFLAEGEGDGADVMSTVPLVPISHLVAMKMATGEPEDEKDAKRLMAFGSEEVDVERARALLHRYGGPSAIARFEQVLREVGHPDAYVRGRYKKA